MLLQKKDFIEIDFTGRIQNGEVFDSTVKSELEKMHFGHSHEVIAKPFTFCLGEGMFLKAIDDFLIGKEPGSYEISLTPEEAFGPRNPAMVQTMPMNLFREKRINPAIGDSFNFDGRIGKVLAVSGGRVIIDFNHSLAGKNLVYNIKVLKKVDKIDDKVKALTEFFFRRDLKYEIKDKKIIFEVEKPLVQFLELFKDKFNEMLSLELEIKEIPASDSEEEKSEN